MNVLLKPKTQQAKLLLSLCSGDSKLRMLGHKRRKGSCSDKYLEGSGNILVAWQRVKNAFRVSCFFVFAHSLWHPFDSASKLRGKKARNNIPL